MLVNGKDCVVRIQTGSCTNGFCPTDVFIQKSLKISFKDDCEPCDEFTDPDQITSGEGVCPVNKLNPFEGGKWFYYRCSTTKQFCAENAGEEGYYQTLDFDCGFGSFGGAASTQGGKQKKLGADLKACLDKTMNDDTISDEDKCKLLCSLVDITDPPGLGGTGGIGNKQQCKKDCQEKYPNSDCDKGPPFASGCYKCVEACKDDLSAKFMEELGKWIQANCWVNKL